METIDYIRKAMQCAADMTQHLNELAKDSDPLTAEVARILIRDANAIKKEIWLAGEILNDGRLEIMPIASRYENTAIENVMYAKESAESMAEAFAPIRCSRSEVISQVANNMFARSSGIAQRLDRIQEAIFQKELEAPVAEINTKQKPAMTF